MRRTIGRILELIIPLELRSYLIRRRPTGLDQASWDQEYATGQWARLSMLAEMPRYAIIAGYSRTISSDASVLDIGCGAGHLLDWIYHDGNRRYVGIDVSSVAIQQACERTSSRQARFEVADAATFDPGDRFDIIVFNEMLYYIEHPELVLERYESFMAPGGVLIISMWRSTESLRTWRRCAARLEVLDEVRLRSANATEWHVWLCRPKQLPDRTA
jgi:2-polyprenyl-3-methyl-5-hydroxy-6-metoxy-1,4-benzoquinol methylase